MSMRVVVIGLGSMGRRRIRLLRQFDPSIKVIGVDSNSDRCLEVGKEYEIDTYESLEKACIETKPECAFVSTSPVSHARIITECLKREMNVFSEINLIDDGYDKNVGLAKEKHLTLFLSSTFMYRKEVEYIKKTVTESKLKKSYIYHVGQYLPDWHPWENIKDFFVSYRRTNGCRELMAIEFPWIVDVFGFPEKWSVQRDKNSLLDLDYPDSYQIILKHSEGNMGIIQVDVVSRKAVRNFECMSEDLYISWDGTPHGLNKYDYDMKKNTPIKLYEEFDKRAEYSDTIIEDAYFSEIKDFFETINGKATPRYSFEKDKKLLAVIDEIEGIV